MPNRILLFICIISLFSSCVGSRRAYYFSDLSPSTEKIDSAISGVLQRIQIGDRLSVIMSTKDQTQNDLLNPLGLTRGGGGNNTVVGYQVQKDGMVVLPVLGLVKLQNLTTQEATEVIREKLSVVYKDPYVNVNLLGRVVVMGTRSPGAVPLFNERLTIFEAIAQTGEIDFSARRDKVWIIREQNGERVSALLNLNAAEIFQSPYYYLKTNDLIYVQPATFNSFLGANAPTRTLFLSIISIAALVIALIQ